MNTESSVCAK